MFLIKDIGIYFRNPLYFRPYIVQFKASISTVNFRYIVNVTNIYKISTVKIL